LVPRRRGRRREDAGGRRLIARINPRRRERRCIATGANRPPAQLIRYAIDASGTVVADAAGRLPGRGMWVSADREAINRAASRNLFARAARRSVSVPDDLAARTERAIAQQALVLLQRMQCSGLVPSDDDAVTNAVAAVTSDAARPASEMRLGAQGRNVVHADLAPNSLTEQFLRMAQRLRGLRGGSAGVSQSAQADRSDAIDRSVETTNAQVRVRLHAAVDEHAVGLRKGLT
jgi:predicted RNA-binding protein YlxR (DUF448 family)